MSYFIRTPPRTQYSTSAIYAVSPVVCAIALEIFSQSDRVKKKGEYSKMLQKISQKISSLFVTKKIIEANQVHIFAYGFEVLLSSFAGILALVLVSLLHSQPFLWIPYILGFVPLRLCGGGYHAKTHLSCLLFFTILYGVTVTFLQVIPSNTQIYLFSVITNLLILLLFAPVAARNKPLKEEQHISNRRKSIFIGSLNCSIYLVQLLLDTKCTQHLFMYFAGASMSGLSILAAVIKQEFERRNQK